MVGTGAETLRVYAMESTEDAAAFRTLNEEWIKRLFSLEEKDRRTLNDPQAQIVAKGGHVFLARLREERVGCVALLDYGSGDFELSKMAVAPGHRGAGIGRKILLEVLGRARQLGIRRIFLGSNTVLANAVHLYEAVGFRHVSPSELPPMGYARADVYMVHDMSST